MAEQIRVKGAAELDKAFIGLRKDVVAELRPELRKAGELVRAEAQRLFADESERSAAGYRVRVRQRGVAVEQSLRRTTGTRPDFGALQMRTALLPALDAKSGEVRALVDVMIDEAAARHGLL